MTKPRFAVRSCRYMANFRTGLLRLRLRLNQEMPLRGGAMLPITLISKSAKSFTECDCPGA